VCHNNLHINYSYYSKAISSLAEGTPLQDRNGMDKICEDSAALEVSQTVLHSCKRGYGGLLVDYTRGSCSNQGEDKTSCNNNSRVEPK